MPDYAKEIYTKRSITENRYKLNNLKFDELGLYEKMVFTADGFLEKNWGDIAIMHLAELEEQWPSNGSGFWILTKFNSYICPLFCDLDSDSEAEITTAEILFFRLDSLVQQKIVGIDWFRIFHIVNHPMNLLREVTVEEFFQFLLYTKSLKV